MSNETLGWIVRIGQLLLSLSILIVLHEMGHYLAARAFKTKVEKFFLFFDYKFALVKKKIGDTVYGIGWIPLGGYVKIAGMIDESMDKEQMKQPPQPWEYRSKPAWQRLIIITGGVIVNLILGFLIFSMSLFIWGSKYVVTDSVKGGLMVTDSAAYEIGLMDGDKILAVDGRYIDQFHGIMPEVVNEHASSITIERNGQEQTIEIDKEKFRKIVAHGKNLLISYRIPFYVMAFGKESNAESAGMKIGDKIVEINNVPVEYFDEVKREFKQYHEKDIPIKVVRAKDTVLLEKVLVSAEGTVGIVLNDSLEKLESEGYLKVNVQHYNFFQSFPAGFKQAVKTVVDYAKQLALVVNPETGAYKQVGGFASIARNFPTEWNWQFFWRITAVLSLILAFMNILPIPGLDGGHMIFILVEMVTRRKFSDKFVEKATMVGFVFLLALMLYANLNDFI